ncbi:MAG: GTP-binding protein [Polyangiaceae bacterium]|nr:GTP-binding protein [Polyangiaceae bacterium]
MTEQQTAAKTRSRRPMSAVLLCGFLGSGKTTLLNRILAESHDLPTAVLVNDFGDVSIDARLIVDVQADTIVLDNGCICCSVRGDLLGALERLIHAPPEERVERVLIEASGIADPRSVLSTFVALDKASTLALDGVVALVDASELADLSLNDLSLVRDQLDQSDLVVVNKLDLATPEQLARCREEVRRFAPRAAVFETSRAEVPLALVLGLSAHPRQATLKSVDHGLEFESLHFHFERPLLLERVRELCVDLPQGVYRAKGVLWLRDLPEHQVILQVVGRRARVDRGAPWGDLEPASDIVLIGRRGSFDAASLEGRFARCAEPAEPKGLLQAFGAWWQR